MISPIDGQGEWTAVIGVMEGRFTEPMPMGGGSTVPLTCSSFCGRMDL